jgi:Protein of unknown function (DUF3168)
VSADQLTGALLAVLREAPAVRDIFGSPARIYDDESAAPAFPFARIERHETLSAGASLSAAFEYRISVAIYSRDGGLEDAKKALNALRSVVEAAPLSVPGYHVVLAHVIYADTLRASDRRLFRGLIRIRIIIEEAI